MLAPNTFHVPRHKDGPLFRQGEWARKAGGRELIADARDTDVDDDA